MFQEQLGVEYIVSQSYTNDKVTIKITNKNENTQHFVY